MANNSKVAQGKLANQLAKRGENIAEDILTNYSIFPAPIFDLAHLGDKWPTADFYAELKPRRGLKPVALFQVKTSSAAVRQNAKSFKCQFTGEDVKRLGRIPLPCYLIGVSEKSRRVFIRLVDKTRKKGMASIPVANELTVARLSVLHAEITSWWRNNGNIQSQFL